MKDEKYVATINIEQDNTLVEQNFVVEGELNKQRLTVLWMRNPDVKYLLFTDFENFSNPEKLFFNVEAKKK